MSVLHWCNGITTLILLIGESCNANQNSKIISSCEMVGETEEPSYHCNRRELLEVPSFPETTLLLDLSFNFIKSLYSDTFADYLNLFSLDLSNNYITSLPVAVFVNNVALQSLWIMNNKLTSLPADVFMNNVALQYLRLSDNIISSLPEAIFKNNVVFERLLFTNNNLTNLPDTVFKYNVALTNIDLDWNFLTTLPLNLFSSNVGLLRLNLEFNQIDSLPQSIFANNLDLQMLYITGNPIDNVETRLFDNHNDIGNLMVVCGKCFDCDCLSVSTYEWITKRVADLSFSEFSCRDGVPLPNTVVNCSDDGSRLAVTIMQHESLCNCKESIAMKSSSTNTTTVATRSMESTIDKVKHKTKTKGSSFTYIGVIISGFAASITLITSFTALRRFINTASRIRHSDLTDTENDIIIENGIDFFKTDNCNVQMNNEYKNIPPKSHMNSGNNGSDFINLVNCNVQMDIEYNNIPPKIHVNPSNEGIDDIRTLKNVLDRSTRNTSTFHLKVT